ncbi:MAG: 3-dehydroquinate synthase [Anaerolineae bacterium]
MRNLVLTGFMGTGKSAVGRRVAERLDRPFVDMDAVIEEKVGKPISRIFAEEGEARFRELEAALCRELSAREGLVIATGGGTLVDSINRATLAASSTLVCLQAGVEEVLRRVGDAADRPMLRAANPRADAERLLAARREAYAAIPWQVKTTARPLEKVVADVAALADVHTLQVSHPGGVYPIHIGEGTLRYLGGALRAAGVSEGTRIAVVSNDVVAPLYAEPVAASLAQSGLVPFLCVLPDGEVHKTPETVRHLYDRFLDEDLNRSGLVMALGGGVTGDIAGFAAATFMRGVHFAQVPTSLLAMTDASVGGKTGVDLPQGKNLIGAFKQPELVFVDLAVLGTLPRVELRSGLAEVIKHGVIGDRELFEEIAARLRNGQAAVSPDILARSIRVKIEVVEQDPFERGRRAVLNLGHTSGHALERLSGYEMRHGEAVSVGMVVAALVSEALGLAPEGLRDRIAQVLVAAGLPVTCPPLPVDDIWRAMRHDKKRRGRDLRWILPVSIGEVVIRDDVPRSVVRSALLRLGAKA